MDKISEMQKLIVEINKHNHNYYDLDAPTISDAEYDKLYYRLIDLEKQTGTVLPNSPSLRVGGEVLEGFKKREHPKKLYSLNKVRDEKDLFAWVRDMKDVHPAMTFSVEYKFDGLHLVIEYDNGEFVSATTRGNGYVGEDVSAQVKTIRSVPLQIAFKGHLFVEGEGMMTNHALKIYNRNAEEKLKNARNAAAGAIRNLDPKETARRNLDFFCYAVLQADGIKFDTQQALHEFLFKNGFQTGDYFKVVSTAEEVMQEINDIDKRKSSLDILIDGVVVSINEIAYREEIGWTTKFPKWAMAYKFEAEEISTVLEDVVWQVGRTGKVTPIAILQPVELAGATVQKATLNNYDDILRKKVSIGSRVFVRRSNEVIPEVLGLAEKAEDAKEIEEISTCPCCGSKLIKKGPLLYCTNHDGCFDQIEGRLTHFASRDAFNIEGLSEKTVRTLINELGVKNPSDLYKLTTEDFLTLEKFKDKKSNNLKNSIEKSKKIDLFRFIYALGIGEVGIKTARDIANHFSSLQAVMKAKLSEIEKINDVGPVIARNILEYFKDQENLQEIQNLIDVGVEIKNPSPRDFSSPIAGKKFVLTGTLSSLSRTQASELILQNGGEVSGSVSKNTDYVLLGENPGSKYAKAQQLNIKIISEQDLIDMINKV